MTRRAVTWLLAILLAIPLSLLAVIGAVTGTEPGTRWLLRQSEHWFPDQLAIGDASGTLLGGVAVTTVTWDDELVSVRASGVELNADLFPLLDRQLRVTRLAADGLEVTVRQRSGPRPAADRRPFTVDLPIDLYVDEAVIDNVDVTTPTMSRRADRIELSANLDGNLLFVRRLAVHSDWFGLSANGSARLGGRYALDVDATWRLQDGDGPEFNGRLELSGTRQQYALAHELTAPVALTTRGSVSFDDGPLSADLEHRWQQVEWTFGRYDLGISEGLLTTRGTLRDFGVTLRTLAEIDGYPEADVELVARADRNGAEIEHLQLTAESGRIDVAGVVEWAGTPEFDVTVSANDLDASLLSSRLDGTVAATGSASGRFPVGAPEVVIGIDSLHGGLFGQPLSGNGLAKLEGDRISLTDTVLALGDNRLRINGSVAESVDLAASLDFDAPAQLDARAAGALQAEIRVAGARNNPQVDVELEAHEPEWAGFSAARLTGTASLSPAQSLHAEFRIDDLLAGTVPVAQTTARLDGTAEAHTFRVRMTDPNGRLALDGEGALDDATWRGGLAALEVTTETLGAWALTDAIEATVSRNAIGLSRFCLANRSTEGRACAEADFAASGGGELSGEIRRFPLAALPLQLPAGVTLEGFLEADVDARFSDGTVDAGADARLAGASILASYEDEPYTLDVTSATLRLDIAANRLSARFDVDVDSGAGTVGGHLTVADILDRDAAIDGSGSVAVPDAAIFTVFIPDISDPEGRVNGSMAVAGRLGAPEFSGEIRLEDGSFGVRATRIDVTDVNASLSQLDAGRLLLRGSANSGDGIVAIDGATMISADTGLRAEMSITGEKFQLARLPDWEISASPDIRVVLDAQTASVTGGLEVPEADITVESIPESATRPSPDVVVHGSTRPDSGRGRRIDVDVNVELGDEVRLSGFGLTTDISGAVRIEGGSRRVYTGNGRLSLSEGRYKAYGQNLEIESGELIFNGPLDNPQLDVRAVRRIEAADVVAGIRLTGTPRRLRSEVFSEPSMADAEALAYLLTGRPLTGATDSGDADLLNQAAFALGLSQAGSIASQIQGDLGLDTFKVEGGAESGRIVAGKRISDRLLVEYGYGLIDKLGTLLLRYQLTNRLVLESRTGTVSELDLVYTVREK